MTLTQFLRGAVRQSFDDDHGYPGLRLATAGLTAAQAAWTPAPGRNSIWQIVRHVTAWKTAILRDTDGVRPDYEAVQAGDWAPVDGDDAAWRQDLAELEGVTRELTERWAALDDDHLLTVQPGRRTNTLALAYDLACHDAYHAGQIRLLRKLQGLP